MLELAKATDYDSARANFKLAIPEYFNFGFDVIEKRAREADKTAFLYVNRDATSIEHHRFSDLDRAANRFANLLIGLGAGKGDFAFVMIPRIPAWYQVLVGCIKTGVVAMPGTNLLTARDIEYRVNKAGAKLAVVTAEHAGIDLRTLTPENFREVTKAAGKNPGTDEFTTKGLPSKTFGLPRGYRLRIPKSIARRVPGTDTNKSDGDGGESTLTLNEARWARLRDVIAAFRASITPVESASKETVSHV